VSPRELPGELAAEEARGLDRDPAPVPELHEVDCPPELRKRIEAAMAKYPDKRSASIPALWAVQKRYGWCSPEGIRQAAAVMGVTPGFLESVASFYDMLKLEPAGRHTVMVCTNISCWLNGADNLLDAFCQATGAPDGSSSPDGEFQLEHFECLGACDIAPMASIDHRYYGPLSADDARTAIEQIRSGEEPVPDKALAKRPAAGGPEPDPDPRVGDG
jgi:NADH-quinone oxidoreductase subunit E